MKKLFKAIREKSYEEVKNILDKSPELISCISVGGAKKDEGQSLLQVALKSSTTEIINFLLDRGADVNFIESENNSNSWRAPAIHDAINRAIMNSRWNVNRTEGLEVFSSKQESDESFYILEKIISLGANVNAKDSYGNSCLNRACLEARKILPVNGSNDRVLTEELKFDLSRIFNLLISKGADLSYKNLKTTGKTCLEEYGNEAVGLFLK